MTRSRSTKLRFMKRQKGISWHLCARRGMMIKLVSHVLLMAEKPSNGKAWDLKGILYRRCDYRIIAFLDRKSTRLNSSHVKISYAVFCLKKKNNISLE